MNTTHEPQQAPRGCCQNEFLTFTLARKSMHRHPPVQEIRGYDAVTAMPTHRNSSRVINLRGIIVPSWTCASSLTWATSNTTSSPW